MKFIVETVRTSLVALIMPIFVVGSVVFGMATANESASFGVMYAIVVGLWIFKGLRMKALPRLFLQAMKTCSSIMLIIAMSKLYVWILTIEKVPQTMAAFVTGMNLSPTLMLVAIMLLILVAGTFIDVTPAILLITPVFLQPVLAAGIQVEQFGALLIAGLAVGAVTPPVGTCLNVASAISKMGIERIFKGAIPFLVGNVIVLLLVCLFPPLTTWLPSLLINIGK